MFWYLWRFFAQTADFVYKVVRAEGQMQKTRGPWRAERSEGKCNRVGLNIEMASGSLVGEGAGGETGQHNSKHRVALFSSQMMSWGEKK